MSTRKLKRGEHLCPGPLHASGRPVFLRAPFSLCRRCAEKDVRNRLALVGAKGA